MQAARLLKLEEVREQKLYTLQTAEGHMSVIVAWLGKDVVQMYNGMMYSRKDYGKMWRLWEYGPTEEQMRSVKWE